jgi:hypothetical protein
MKKTDFIWETFDGQKVPESAISPFDKKKEPKVRSILKKLQAARKATLEAEEFMQKTADTLAKEMYANKGVEYTLNDSFTIYSYDKSIKIEARKNAILQLTDDVNIAYKLFNEYLEEAITSDQTEIKRLVLRAFSTSKGELDPKRLLTLLGMNITHDKWVQAADVLRQAISTNSTKRYIKMSLRNATGEYESI